MMTATSAISAGLPPVARMLSETPVSSPKVLGR